MGTSAPTVAGQPKRTLSHATVYQVAALPDCEDPVYRLTAGGSVQPAIRACQELLLRSLATQPAGSAALTIRFAFTPTAEPAKRQSRLAISIRTAAHDEQTAHTLRLLIECSDLAVYYRLQTQPSTDGRMLSGLVEYHITRSEQAVRPLHTPADNPAIPPVYYVCCSFIPRSSNDHRTLDRILDRVTEPVEIEMAVESVDITEERFQHSAYMARLQSINRLHGYDEEESVQSDPFEPDRYHRAGRATVVQPLRRRDPIADDILAVHRRFHENLSGPHLAFSLRVAARTPAVAHLIASVLAESAFEGGSYRLWPSDGAPNPSGQHPASTSHGNAVTPPTLDLVLEKHAAAYRAFGRLAHVATVDELLSALVLPVATRGGPRCMRKNTEPPIVPREQLLVFGHDE